MNKKLRLKIIERFDSQANFAQIIKTDESMISRVVRGRRVLSDKKMQEWANALTCEVSDVFESKKGN